MSKQPIRTESPIKPPQRERGRRAGPKAEGNGGGLGRGIAGPRNKQGGGSVGRAAAKKQRQTEMRRQKKGKIKRGSGKEVEGLLGGEEGEVGGMGG